MLTTFLVQDIAANIYPRLGDGAPPRIEFAWNPDRYTADDIARHITRLELLFDRLLVADVSVVARYANLHGDSVARAAVAKARAADKDS